MGVKVFLRLLPKYVLFLSLNSANYAVRMDTIAAYQRSRPRFSDVAPPTDAHAPSQHLSALRQLPHSTASLGPAFRSRSLDHRRFSNFDTETRGGLSRTYYASKPGGGGARAYAPSASQQKAELFRESGKREQKPQVQPRLSQMNSDAYRSNSAERAGNYNAKESVNYDKWEKGELILRF